jgi:hypothetical protein
MENKILTCPKCGGLLVPITYQEGLYSCELCGEVEDDGDGFIVDGKFYQVEANENNNFGEIDSEWDFDENDPEKELTFGDVFGDMDLSGEVFEPSLEPTQDLETLDLSDSDTDLDPLTEDLFVPEDDPGALRGNF